ncbi:hypothetical protein SBDP1_1040049 [Syntrophobacter sp. SbD1]|nr:hypothetical protein SBDP1_1040049 [Syntrophobacter sp. SbD1]
MSSVPGERLLSFNSKLKTQNYLYRRAPSELITLMTFPFWKSTEEKSKDQRFPCIAVGVP